MFKWKAAVGKRPPDGAIVCGIRHGVPCIGTFIVEHSADVV
jgi:hypothetical protein